MLSCFSLFKINLSLLYCYATRALRVPIWLLRLLNERPQISEVVNAGWIGLYANWVDVGERATQVEVMADRLD
jgi:hypothetical protein